MNGMMRVCVCAFAMIVLPSWGAQVAAQAEDGRPKRPSVHEPDDNEVAAMKADLTKMQSLLTQMQAVFALVGNPTLPANHELELNIDMWRLLIGQLQRRVKRMEEAENKTNRRDAEHTKEYQ
jgi:hypothetical protein